MKLIVSLAHLRSIIAILSFVLLAACYAEKLAAVEPDEILKDPKLEERARDLSAELRCVVCQNQSIDDSNAPLARDLRLLVRERLKAGDSDKDVIDFIVARYGEFVLLRPSFGWHTALLWLLPLFLLLGGVALARLAMTRTQTTQTSERLSSAKPLNIAERKRVEELLKTNHSSS